MNKALTPPRKPRRIVFDDASELCLEGGDLHCFKNTGLDVVNDVLSSTRGCVWCGVSEYKPYQSRKAWKREVPAL